MIEIEVYLVRMVEQGFSDSTASKPGIGAKNVHVPMSGGEILEFLQRNERRRELGADHDRLRRQKVADKPSEDLPILLV